MGAGLLAGILYGVLNVRSPAPPVVALVGLLGILLGEQLPPLVRQWLEPKDQQVSWLHEQVKPHCFGELPGASTKEETQ
nr:DUF1427 family protein [Massilia eburnea]